MAMIRCRHGCKTPDVALYYLSDGCACFPDRIQALCEQHADKATPIGTMECVMPWNECMETFEDFCMRNGLRDSRNIKHG